MTTAGFASAAGNSYAKALAACGPPATYLSQVRSRSLEEGSPQRSHLCQTGLATLPDLAPRPSPSFRCPARACRTVPRA